MSQEKSKLEDISTDNVHSEQADYASIIEKAFESGSNTPLLVQNPITLSYFDIQRLVYLQKQSSATKVHLSTPYRSGPEIQGLCQKIEKAMTSGVTVDSVAIHVNLQYTENINSNAGSILDFIDLVLYLSKDQASSVQGFNKQPAKSGLSVPQFTLLAGSLVSGGSFSVHIGNKANDKNLTAVQVALSNGEIFQTSVAVQPNIKPNTNEDSSYGTLEESAKALRVYACAVRSLETNKTVIIKYIGDKVIPVRTIGTAKILRAGLFLPASTTTQIGVTGVYSAKTDRVRDIYNERVQEGEPFEYFPSNEVLLNNPFFANRTWRPVFYIPSLPGVRKNKEMIEALKAGYTVLAEKPGFANVDVAREFLKNLNKEHQKQLFFGWHYLHHFVFRKLVNDVSMNSFGKVKHVRTYFTAPKLMGKTRVFDPAQGGAGVDINSYNLHYTLRLIGFNHSFEVVQSKITSGQFLDTANPELNEIDFTLDTKLKFSNGTTADLYASFDSTNMLHTEAEVLFEDGTRIWCKEYCHPQMVTAEKGNPVLIYRAGGARWENYLTGADLENPEYWKTTYERQLEFIRRQATGEEKYDVVDNDVDGIGLDANVKMHEIMDAIFVAGGFAKKKGA